MLFDCVFVFWVKEGGMGFVESWDFYRVALGVTAKVCVFVCVCCWGGHLAKQRYRGSRLIMMANRGAGICLLTPRLCCFSHANRCLSVGDLHVCVWVFVIIFFCGLLF